MTSSNNSKDLTDPADRGLSCDCCGCMPQEEWRELTSCWMQLNQCIFKWMHRRIRHTGNPTSTAYVTSTSPSHLASHQAIDSESVFQWCTDCLVCASWLVLDKQSQVKLKHHLQSSVSSQKATQHSHITVCHLLISLPLSPFYKYLWLVEGDSSNITATVAMASAVCMQLKKKHLPPSSITHHW